MMTLPHASDKPSRAHAAKAVQLRTSLEVFIAYALTFIYDDENVETFYGKLEMLHKEARTQYKMTRGDINAKIGPRSPLEELHIRTKKLE